MAEKTSDNLKLVSGCLQGWGNVVARPHWWLIITSVIQMLCKKGHPHT